LRAVEMGTCSALGMEIEVEYNETKKTGIRDGWVGGKEGKEAETGKRRGLGSMRMLVLE
jgi:hypothetical protein